MANTLINSELFTNLVNEKMTGRGRLVQFAGDLGNLPNGVQAGDTYSILKVAHLSEMVDLAKGATIPLEDIKVTKSSETIEHKAKGFSIYDVEKETTIGGKDMITLKAQDLADIRIRALEKSLGEKATKAPLKYQVGSPDSLYADDIDSALTKTWGDAQDAEEFDGIIVNSRLLSSLYAMEAFTKSELTHTTDGNGVIRNGLVGYYRAIPIYVSDVTTYDTVKKECITFILKKGALGYKTITGEVEIERNASKKADEVYDDYMFVTGVVDDTAICVMRKTIA